MTPEQLAKMFEDDRRRKAEAVRLLSTVPSEALAAVLAALEAFLEFDEEGVKELLREAIAAQGEAK